MRAIPAKTVALCVAPKGGRCAEAQHPAARNSVRRVAERNAPQRNQAAHFGQRRLSEHYHQQAAGELRIVEQEGAALRERAQ
jgi:hypothetical protein